MKRRDGPAIREGILRCGVMVVLAAAGIAPWPGLAGGSRPSGIWMLHASGADSCRHEAGHSAAFCTPWMNDVAYHAARFMRVRNPATWRWSHVRHHADTIVVGRDPEFITMRPPDTARAMLLFVGLDSIGPLFKMFR